MGQGSKVLTRARLLCVIILITINGACLHDTIEKPNGDVSNANATPVADAGRDRTIVAGQSVILSGEASSDLEGSPLSYHWQVVENPQGVSFSIDNPTSPSINITPPAKGKYRIHLVVSDGELTSAPDEITVNVTNNIPDSRPTFLGSPTLNNTITLDGSQSRDLDGHALSYTWLLLSKPLLSQSFINQPNAAKTELYIDASGTYVVHLSVSDGYDVSQPAMLTINVNITSPGGVTPPVIERQPPVADAGKDIILFTSNIEYQLDGSGSYDTNAQSISHLWKMLRRPPGSTATITNPTSITPGFVPEKRGSYVFELETTNFSQLSDRDTVVVTDKRMGLLCADCHNGEIAIGPTNHPEAIRDLFWDCGECHRIATWNVGSLVPGSPLYQNVTQDSIPLPYSTANANQHIGVTSRCDECHLTQFIQAAATHPTTSTRCNACHNTTQWQTKLTMEHTKALGPCLNCHNKDKPIQHPATTKDCKLCHDKVDWTRRIDDPHLQAQSLCVSCHELNITTFHNNHDVYGDNCGQCHNTAQWTPVSATAKHLSVLSDCYYCHNGNIQRGKPARHLPTTNNCEYCHTIVAFKQTYTFDHEQVSPKDTPCSDCHDLPQ